MNIFKRNEQTNDPFEGVGMGDKVKDTLSGFTGVVIGRAEHMTGCHQVYVLPTSEKDNEIKAGNWFDIERVEKVEANVATVKSRLTGADIPSPRMAGRAL